MSTWRDFALCSLIGEPLETFFPEDTHDRTAHRFARARAICAECEVRPECLAAEVDHTKAGAFYGIGGRIGSNVAGFIAGVPPYRRQSDGGVDGWQKDPAQRAEYKARKRAERALAAQV